MIPLRDHLEDIPELCQHFLEAFAAQEHKAVPRLDDELLASLRRHSWSSNVRELEGYMYRAVVCGEDHVRLANLDFTPTEQAPESPRVVIQALERDHAKKVLLKHNGDVTRAARELGMHRSTFYDKFGRNLLSE
jgi:DNA-binding NtrC family response regulator